MVPVNGVHTEAGTVHLYSQPLPRGCCPEHSAAMLLIQGMNRWLLTLSDDNKTEMHLLWKFSFFVVFVEGFMGLILQENIFHMFSCKQIPQGQLLCHAQ